MASIPPTGWARAATNRDLDAPGSRLELHITASGDRLRAEMAELRTEMADLRAEVADRLRTQTQVMVVTLVVLAAVVITAVRI